MTTMKWVVLLSVLAAMVMGASLGGPGLWGAAVLTVVLLVFQRRVKVLEAENLHQEADLSGWARACRTIQDQRDKAQTEAQRWFNLLCACRAKALGYESIELSEAAANDAVWLVGQVREEASQWRLALYQCWCAMLGATPVAGIVASDISSVVEVAESLRRACDGRLKETKSLRMQLAETERIRDNATRSLADMITKYNTLLRRRRAKKSKVRR